MSAALFDQKRLTFLTRSQNKNWVRLTVVNVRAVKNAVQLHEKVKQMLRLDKLIKIEILAATL